MTKQEDIHIIKRIKAGEITAFSDLIDRHQGMVFTLVSGILKNREEAEEVTQDSFLKAFQHLSGFKGESAFSSWLYRIAYNTAISKKRLKKLNVTPLENNEAKNEETNHTMDCMKRLETTDRKRFLKKAISKLGGDDAAVVLLYYYKDLPVEQIAEITNMSVSNVKVKLFRSRQKLYSELSKLLNKELTNI